MYLCERSDKLKGLGMTSCLGTRPQNAQHLSILGSQVLK